jgi:hypothetical protein
MTDSNFVQVGQLNQTLLSAKRQKSELMTEINAEIG